MVSWQSIRKRSAVARKAWDFANQVPRCIARATASPADYRAHPPALGNSFPKSGTHQLLQILEAFPGMTHFGSFLASTPTLTLRERSPASHLARIAALVPTEYLGAHLFFHDDFATALARKNAVHFFIYRDLRDVAVSEAFYLADMNRWHRMHRHFASMPNDGERLATAIDGIGTENGAYYPDIGTRMRRFLPWIGRPDVFTLKYEDLNSDRREELVRAMVEFYAAHADTTFDHEEVVARALSRLDPARSHTFREGGSGKWKVAFAADHLRRFEDVAGDINHMLGYT